MINRTMLLFIIFAINCSVFAIDNMKVLDALYTEVRLSIKNGKSPATSIAYLNEALYETDLVQAMMDRSMELVEKSGGTDPSLYFLLLEYSDPARVRKMIQDDLAAGRYPLNSDQELMTDFLCSYFGVMRPNAVPQQADTDSPFMLDLTIEMSEKGIPDAVITISNRTERGRFFMNSGDAMDYLGLERPDGVVIPSVRRRSPVIPVFLNRGESIVKRCSLRMEVKDNYPDKLRSIYPIENIPGFYTPCSFFSGSRISHLSLNGEIISFGPKSIPLNLYVRYDEHSLFSRMAANNFDRGRMPWVQAYERYRIAKQMGDRITPQASALVHEPQQDWYPKFLNIRSVSTLTTNLFPVVQDQTDN